jgi:hypothetical protein
MDQTKMADIAYHFRTVTAASPTDDGQSIVLTVEGAAGECGISIPTETAGRAALLILEASAGARQISGNRTLQAVGLKEICLFDHPDRSKVVLAITIHSGAAPLSFELRRSDFQDFALGVLQTMGILDAKPGGRAQ